MSLQWIARETPDAFRVVLLDGGETYPLAVLPRHPLSSHREDDTVRRSAALMAAAPELYSAVERLIGAVDATASPETKAEALAFARAAIAKVMD
jgi:hypothetical protein